MFGIFNDCFPPVMDGVSVATRNYAYWLHQKGEQVCVVTPSADEYEDREPFPVLRYCSIPLIFRNPYRMGLPQFDRHIRKSLNDAPARWTPSSMTGRVWCSPSRAFPPPSVWRKPCAGCCGARPSSCPRP